jgi:VWFA-related protein
MSAVFVAVSALTYAVLAQERDPQVRFGISTTAVALDVVVRDRTGAPTTGLGVSEFEVYEDGIRQKITAFEEFGGRGRAISHSPILTERSHLKDADQPHDAEPESFRVALVFEELGTAALRLAHSAASTFLAQPVTPRISFGIFTLDRAVRPISPFTDDRALLSKALHSVSLRPGRPIERAGDVPGAEYAGSHPGQSARSTADDNQFVRGHATLAGLDAVVGVMEASPGRKAIVLFSEGLALGADPTGAGTPDSALADNRWQHLLRVVDRANRSQIAFYTFDAGGLRAQNPSAAARYSMGLSPFGVEPYVGLETLARETGGRYSGNTNDLLVGLERMSADLEHFYLLAYSPTRSNADGKYRRVEVKVKRRGLLLLYRKGYLATGDPLRPK